MFPIFYINLPQASRRRTHVEQQLARVGLPDVHVHRMEAVDGHRMAASLVKDDRLGLFSRLLLTQPARASSHMQIETVGAVGCTLSHVKCWDCIRALRPTALRPCRRMVAHQSDAALILEDDACLGPGFLDSWFSTVVPLLGVPARERQWDVLLLGFSSVQGTRPVTVHGVPLRTFLRHPDASFFGTHAYVLTQRGATILLQHVFPIEVQVDAYLLLLQQLGRLGLFLLRSGPAVKPCLAAIDRSIRHGFRSRFRERLTILILLLLLVSSWVVLLRRCGRM